MKLGELLMRDTTTDRGAGKLARLLTEAADRPKVRPSAIHGTTPPGRGTDRLASLRRTAAPTPFLLDLTPSLRR
jgi:hypothetical protein